MGAKYVTTACGNEDGMGEETDFTSEMKSSEKTLSVLLQHISDTFSTCLVCRKYSITLLLFEKMMEKMTADCVIKNQSTKSYHKTQGTEIWV